MTKEDSARCIRPLDLVKLNRPNMPMKEHPIKISGKGERFQQQMYIDSNYDVSNE